MVHLTHVVGSEADTASPEKALLMSTVGVASDVLKRFSREVIILLDHSGLVAQADDSIERTLGYRAETLIGWSPLKLVHPDDQGTALEIWRAGPGPPGPVRRGLRFIDRGGTVRWMDTTSTRISEPDGTAGIVVNLVDVTDPPNHPGPWSDHGRAGSEETEGVDDRLLVDRLDQALARASRSGKTVVVLAVRIDQLGALAERHGERAIEQLFGHLGSRLHVALRPSDTVARLTPDTFVVVCDDLTADPEVRAIISRVRRTVAEPFRIGGAELTVDPTIGVVVAVDRHRRAEALLADAVDALANDASDGTESQPATPLRRDRSRTHNGLDQALAAALDQGRLAVLYQPTIDLVTGQIIGAEALLRWPGGPIDDTQELISVAESTGLIVRVGRWVLQQACAQLSVWRAHPRLSARDLKVNVNLSGRQLTDPTLLADMTAIAAETGIDPGLITLEITESVLMDDIDATAGILSSLKALGFRLSVDDFGTGYSSLTYLSRFPIDGLKVDGSFVRDLGSDPDQTAIVESVVELATKLGISATAEGVESETHLQILRELGCDLAQGYLIAEPLTAAEFTDRLIEDPTF